MHRLALSCTLVALFALAPFLAPSGTALAAATTPIYDSIPNPLPPSLPSYGAQPGHFREFGDQIAFAGTVRRLDNVVLTMDSWACQTGGSTTNDCATTPGATFSEPITFNIYRVGANNAVGPRITTKTQTFAIPYRPSEDDVHCTGNDAGAWYDASTNTCQDGYAVNITFNFLSKHVTLPNKVIYGISYNTTTYGYQPYGTGTACFSSPTGCPYDSLNVGLASTPPSVGTDVDPTRAYVNTDTPAEYCDNGAAGFNTFRLDSPSNGCWAPYTPSVEFNAANPGTSSGFGPCSSESTCPSAKLVNDTRSAGRRVTALFSIQGEACTATKGGCNFSYKDAVLNYRDTGPGGVTIPTCSQSSSQCPLVIDSFQCTSTSSAKVFGRYTYKGTSHTFSLTLVAGSQSSGSPGTFTITVDAGYTYTGTNPSVDQVKCPTFSGP